MHTLFQLYGLDWLASLLAAGMIWSLGNGWPVGFAFGLGANLAWLAFALLTASLPILLANIVSLALNIRGFRNRQPRTLQEHSA